MHGTPVGIEGQALCSDVDDEEVDEGEESTEGSLEEEDDAARHAFARENVEAVARADAAGMRKVKAAEEKRREAADTAAAVAAAGVRAHPVGQTLTAAAAAAAASEVVIDRATYETRARNPLHKCPNGYEVYKTAAKATAYRGQGKYNTLGFKHACDLKKGVSLQRPDMIAELKKKALNYVEGM